MSSFNYEYFNIKYKFVVHEDDNIITARNITDKTDYKLILDPKSTHSNFTLTKHIPVSRKNTPDGRKFHTNSKLIWDSKDFSPLYGSKRKRQNCFILAFGSLVAYLRNEIDTIQEKFDCSLFAPTFGLDERTPIFYDLISSGLNLPPLSDGPVVEKAINFKLKTKSEEQRKFLADQYIQLTEIGEKFDFSDSRIFFGDDVYTYGTTSARVEELLDPAFFYSFAVGRVFD